MIGELLVTALVSGSIGYTWSLTRGMESPFFDDAQIQEIHGQGFLSTEDFMSFSVISVFGASVIEIYLAPPDTINIEYQPSENTNQAYSVPITIPETGQFGLFGDDIEGQFFEMTPGIYQVIAESRYLHKDELPPYAEIFPRLNFFLEKEWGFEASAREWELEEASRLIDPQEDTQDDAQTFALELPPLTFDLRDDALELWQLTFIPTDEPTEAIELYRRLTYYERQQRGLQ